MDSKTSLFYSRLITAILSVIALVLAYFSSSNLVYTIVSYVWAGIGSTFSIVILLTLFWKPYHGIAALLTIISGLLFTIIWISTGMDEIITSRLLTFVVAGFVAVSSTYLFKKREIN